MQGNKELQRAADDPTRFHIVGDMNRIGVSFFMTKLEYTHYPPRSVANHLFEFRILKWPANFPLVWAIASIPIEDRPLAEALLPDCGLRLANGTPIILGLGGEKDEFFPMQGDRVFSLENSNGHPIYNNNQAEIEALRVKQNAEIEEILQNDHQKMIKELRDQGLNDKQIERVLAQWQNGNEDYMKIIRRVLNE